MQTGEGVKCAIAGTFVQVLLLMVMRVNNNRLTRRVCVKVNKTDNVFSSG